MRWRVYARENKFIALLKLGSTGVSVASLFFTIRETTEYLNHLHTEVQKRTIKYMLDLLLL